MTRGFIDSASIHSAFAALSPGPKRRITPWERQCLLETTYLLLFTNIGVVPGPGAYRGASGLFAHVVRTLPSLENPRFDRSSALRTTKAWLRRSPTALRRAWEKLNATEEFSNWGSHNRQLFWIDHVRMHSDLFDEEFIPSIASAVGCSERQLREVHKLTQDEATVRRWLKSDLATDDARLASDAYFISALIRGRFHEQMAVEADLQLAAHPFRRSVGRALRKQAEDAVYNSEEYFAKAIIGSSLMETTWDRRVSAWSQNISKARRAISLRQIALPDATVDSDAERCAAEAARACGISASYSRLHREMEFAVALGLGKLVSVVVFPWSLLLAPLVVVGYRHLRGVSAGEDLAKLSMDTTRRFKRLARSFPGRIERTLLPERAV